MNAQVRAAVPAGSQVSMNNVPDRALDLAVVSGLSLRHLHYVAGVPPVRADEGQTEYGRESAVVLARGTLRGKRRPVSTGRAVAQGETEGVNREEAAEDAEEVG